MPNTGLLLIDFQTGFRSPVWGERNNPSAENNAACLLGAWRDQGDAVFHVRHLSTTPDSPLHPNQNGTDFLHTLAPDGEEPVFEKQVNAAFIGTDLEQHLRAADITDLVICGLTTPHCVSTTCRMAANLGFTVTLVHDACATFSGNADTGWSDLPPMSADDIHNTAISHLHGEFVTARKTADIIQDHA